MGFPTMLNSTPKLDPLSPIGDENMKNCTKMDFSLLNIVTLLQI